MNSSARGQLIPRPEVAPPSVRHLPLEKRIQLWAELVDESEAFLLSGMRARNDNDGDVQAAYCKWYARRMEEHDRQQICFAENLTRLERGHGK